MKTKALLKVIIITKRGKAMKIYMEGHNQKRGYVVRREFSDLPPKFYNKPKRWVDRLIDKYNRIFG